MQYRREDRVKVQLKVNKPLFGYPGRPGDYYVAVTGSGLQLGYSDPKKAPRCQPIGHNLWVKDIWLLKNSDINFKFLVVRRSSNAIVDMEKTQQRHLYIENKPVSVEVIFNKPRFTAKEFDEQTCMVASNKQKTDTSLLPNKAQLQAHLKVRSPPKYTLSGNIEVPQPKRHPSVMNKLNDGPTPTLKKQEESMQLQKQEEERLNATKQAEGREITKPTSALTNDRATTSLTSAMTIVTALTPPIMTHYAAQSSVLGKRNDEGINSEKEEITHTTEMVKMHQDTDEETEIDTQSTSQDTDTERATDTRSTTSTCFPCSRRKLVLVVAGVAAVSYLGYYAFFSK